MKKIEAIIRPERLKSVKDILNQCNVIGLTITQVMGCGNQMGKCGFYRGAMVNYILLPKIKIEVVCADAHAEELTKFISEAGKTGAVGDGKIFVSNVMDAIRIRTGEHGETAI